MEKFPNALLRKVDIGGWETAAGKQALGEFKIRGTPSFRVFDGSGASLGGVEGPNTPSLEQILAKAAK